jgi:hypothetical protein
VHGAFRIHRHPHRARKRDRRCLRARRNRPRRCGGTSPDPPSAPNCVGLTKIETTTRRASRARSTSERWPACRRPWSARGRSSSPAARHPRTCSRRSSTERAIAICPQSFFGPVSTAHRLDCFRPPTVRYQSATSSPTGCDCIGAENAKSEGKREDPMTRKTDIDKPEDEPAIRREGGAQPADRASFSRTPSSLPPEDLTGDRLGRSAGAARLRARRDDEPTADLGSGLQRAGGDVRDGLEGGRARGPAHLFPRPRRMPRLALGDGAQGADRSDDEDRFLRAWPHPDRSRPAPYPQRRRSGPHQCLRLCRETRWRNGSTTSARSAGELGLLGVKGFVFQEGHDPDAAMAFREIARLTGGAYERFDASAPGALEGLCARRRPMPAGASGRWKLGFR